MLNGRMEPLGAVEVIIIRKKKVQLECTIELVNHY